MNESHQQEDYLILLFKIMTTLEQTIQQKILLQSTLNQESSAIKNELLKIDSLEAKLQEMQFQLLTLNKMQKSCDKKNHEGLQQTLITIRNKVNLTQAHSKVLFALKPQTKQRQYNQKQTLEAQRSKVKQIRQRQIKELQNAKKQNQKMKQNMMRQIRQISSKNESVIKRMKSQILQKNRNKATMIKTDKESFKQSLIESKIKEMKEKHELQMTRSKIRIQKKDQLERKFQELFKEKQLIESRVQQKRQYNKRLQDLKNNISKMNDDEISKTIKEIKGKIKDYEKDSDQLEEGHNFQKDEEYIKYKLFEKFFQAEKTRRAEKENFVY